MDTNWDLAGTYEEIRRNFASEERVLDLSLPDLFRKRFDLGLGDRQHWPEPRRVQLCGGKVAAGQVPVKDTVARYN